jgi:hypothetical protein
MVGLMRLEIARRWMRVRRRVEKILSAWKQVESISSANVLKKRRKEAKSSFAGIFSENRFLAPQDQMLGESCSFWAATDSL